MNIKECLSTYQIAQILNRTPQGVHNAIQRLGIKPAFQLPNNYRYFAPTTIGLLEKKMRKSAKKDVSK